MAPAISDRPMRLHDILWIATNETNATKQAESLTVMNPWRNLTLHLLSDDVLFVFSIVYCVSLANQISAGVPVRSGTSATCANLTVAANFSLCAARMKTVKSQWKAVEPTRCEAQNYSNNADERGEYRKCRIDVVVVAKKAKRESSCDGCRLLLIADTPGGLRFSAVGKSRRVDSEFRTAREWMED
jgi:hypothetical protein